MLGVSLLIGLALFLAWPASQVLLVILASIMFAVFIDALAALIPRRLAIPDLIARIGVVLLLVALIAVFFVVAGARVGDQFTQLSERLPRGIELVHQTVSHQPWHSLLYDVDLDQLKPSPALVMSKVTGVFSTAFGAITSMLVIVFIGFYLAIQPRLYIEGFIHLVPKQRRDRACKLIQALGHALRWWMLGRFLSMVTVGILTIIGLEIINMPLALVLGVIAGLFSFVPFVGPIVAAIPGILVALQESPAVATYAIVVYAVVQFLEGNVATPLIQKRVVSLPPAIMLIAQLFMGIFYGLFGLLLATPLAVVFIVAIQELYVRQIINDPVPLLGDNNHGPE